MLRHRVRGHSQPRRPRLPADGKGSACDWSRRPSLQAPRGQRVPRTLSVAVRAMRRADARVRGYIADRVPGSRRCAEPFALAAAAAFPARIATRDDGRPLRCWRPRWRPCRLSRCPVGDLAGLNGHWRTWPHYGCKFPADVADDPVSGVLPRFDPGPLEFVSVRCLVPDHESPAGLLPSQPQ